MTDSACDIVVFPVIQNDRYRFQGSDEVPVSSDLFLRYFFCGRQDVISVFDKMRLGIGKSAFFLSCHRMSADKVFFHIQSLDLLMDGSFYTSHVRKDAVRAHEVF